MKNLTNKMNEGVDYERLNKHLSHINPIFVNKIQQTISSAKWGSKFTPTTQSQNDPVNHPNHYTQGKVECIDAIESAVTNLKGIEAVDTANVIKYMWRWKEKNGTQDLDKAKWYLEKLIEIVKDSQNKLGD